MKWRGYRAIALGGADMYAHGELRARMDYSSPYSPAPAPAASSRLGDGERRAVLAELADIHDEAAGLGEHIGRDDLVSLGRSFMDGHGPADDMAMIASHAAAKTAHAAAPAALTLDDVVEGQFATCRAPTACGQARGLLRTSAGPTVIRRTESVRLARAFILKVSHAGKSNLGRVI
jgi:hypothetical protein